MLTLRHSVFLSDVQLKRHEFQIGDDLVQLRSDGERDDVIHGQLVSSVGASGDGGGLPPAHVLKAFRCEAAEPLRDGEVSQHGGDGEACGLSAHAGDRHGLGGDLRRVPAQERVTGKGQGSILDSGVL